MRCIQVAKDKRQCKPLAESLFSRRTGLWSAVERYHPSRRALSVSCRPLHNTAPCLSLVNQLARPSIFRKPEVRCNTTPVPEPQVPTRRHITPVTTVISAPSSPLPLQPNVRRFCSPPTSATFTLQFENDTWHTVHSRVKIRMCTEPDFNCTCCSEPW